MSVIIVTGAGGFVGRKLVERLRARGETVIGIGRSAAAADWPEDARWVRADLNDAAAYETALTGADCVLHLAATTGKAPPAAYQRGNVEATRALLDASVRSGVKRFVLVSSIAAKFADRRFYPYAESKIAAEALVRAAPIETVIVRPTMILGAGSPIEESLAKLAGLPIAPIFGDGRRQVQPIDVDDVADALAAIAQGAAIEGGLIELGGADRYDLRALYARLRGAPVRFAHLPLTLTRHALALAEKPLLPLLPLTAGQLSTFVNDGLADPHPAATALLPSPRPAPRANRASPPSGPSGEALDKEFTRHARYVAGIEPTAYQKAKNRDFHAKRTLEPANALDALLLKVSRLGGVGLALADSYSGLLYRRSVVRAKLVLALALLESSAPSFAVLDAPDKGGRLVVFNMALRGMMAGVSTLIAALVFLPAHVVLGLTGKLKPA